MVFLGLLTVVVMGGFLLGMRSRQLSWALASVVLVACGTEGAETGSSDDQAPPTPFVEPPTDPAQTTATSCTPIPLPGALEVRSENNDLVVTGTIGNSTFQLTVVGAPSGGVRVDLDVDGEPQSTDEAPADWAGQQPPYQVLGGVSGVTPEAALFWSVAAPGSVLALSSVDGDLYTPALVGAVGGKDVSMTVVPAALAGDSSGSGQTASAPIYINDPSSMPCPVGGQD